MVVVVVVMVVSVGVVGVERCLIFRMSGKIKVLPVEVGVEEIISGSTTRIFPFVVGGRKTGLTLGVVLTCVLLLTAALVSKSGEKL